jgi:hypothetical protein
MKTYSVDLTFVKSAKCPVFGTTLQAMDKIQAEKDARYWAQMNGYVAQVKKAEIKEVMP